MPAAAYRDNDWVVSLILVVSPKLLAGGGGQGCSSRPPVVLWVGNLEDAVKVILCCLLVQHAHDREDLRFSFSRSFSWKPKR